MAINRIDAPATTPATFWPQVINQLAALVLDKEDNERIVGGFVKQGSLFNVGGILYVADADTAISGTEITSLAVKITPSGATASASYVSSLTGVTWNSAYKGWYDISGNLYVRDYVTAGNYLIPGMDTSILPTFETTSTTYVKAYEFKISKSGIYRTYFTMSGGSVYNRYGRIYKNGVAVGTERIATSVPLFNTEDLSFQKGDLIQVYAKVDSGGTTYIPLFRLCSSDEGGLLIL